MVVVVVVFVVVRASMYTFNERSLPPSRTMYVVLRIVVVVVTIAAFFSLVLSRGALQN